MPVVRVVVNCCASRCRGAGARVLSLCGTEDAAVPGRCDGLRRLVELPTADAGRRCRCRRRPRSQHKPGVHALLVRTGGSLCPVQTESDSSPRARACQSLYLSHILTRITLTLHLHTFRYTCLMTVRSKVKLFLFYFFFFFRISRLSVLTRVEDWRKSHPCRKKFLWWQRHVNVRLYHKKIVR